MRLLIWCLLLVLAVLGGYLYAYGGSALAFILSLLALGCPILAGWLYYQDGRASSSSDREAPRSFDSHDRGKRS